MRLARNYQAALAPFVSTDWHGQLFEAIDRRIKIAVFDPQHLQPLAHFLFVHEKPPHFANLS